MLMNNKYAYEQGSHSTQSCLFRLIIRRSMIIADESYSDIWADPSGCWT